MHMLRNLLRITAILAAALAIAAFLLALFGYRPFILQSTSMEPLYTKGSLCLVNTRADLNSLEVGDVLVYRSPTNTLVLHRLVGFEPQPTNTQNATSYTVNMQGDANQTAQVVELNKTNFIGQLTLAIPNLGGIVEALTTSKVVWVAALVLLVLACMPWKPTASYAGNRC